MYKYISIILILALTMFASADEMKKMEKPKAEALQEETVKVLMKTSMGDITLELNKTKAPITVENFINYANDKAYDGTIFHRVISNFMIQGGGFNPDMTKRETNPGIENEWQNGLKNAKGTIAMARLGGQANSATNQFFINVQDNFGLDQPRDGAGYAVFGKVIAGMDVVDKIKMVETTALPSGYRDVPVEPVIIESMTVMGEKMPADDMKSEEEMNEEKSE